MTTIDLAPEITVSLPVRSALRSLIFGSATEKDAALDALTACGPYSVEESCAAVAYLGRQFEARWVVAS